MVKQITLDDDVYLGLCHKASELNMVFCSENDVLRVILNMTKQEGNMNVDNYPSSKVPEIQNLLNGLREVIFSISKNGMQYHSNTGRWVANPNTVAIKVQDARARNLRVTVYGSPDKFKEYFSGTRSSLDIQDDMSSYSRFVLANESQLPYAVEVIRHSYDIKKDRGRL